MSREALLALAKTATADFSALVRIQALSDGELRACGLDADEITAVRNGYFERLALLGSFEGDDWRASACCGG